MAETLIDRHWRPVGWAMFAALLWMLFVADPCLVDGLPTITECRRDPATHGVVLTRGDVIIRLAVLALEMLIFGLAYALADSTRRSFELALAACAGLTLAISIHMTFGSVVAPANQLLKIYFFTWFWSAIVTGLAAMTGAAIGTAANSEQAK